MKRAITALCLAVVCHPATAGFETGNELYAKCPPQVGNEFDKEAAGAGYIVGVFDSWANDKTRPVTFCPPHTISHVQVRDIVCRWLANNPQHRHVDASALVAVSLSEVWPCQIERSPAP